MPPGTRGRGGRSARTYAFAMARVLIVVGLLALAFTVYSIVDCALADRSRIRALPRPVWILVILVLPVLGGALWFLIGAGRVAGPALRYVGPDDDPEFIRGAGTAAPAPTPGDDEWLRLEQELAAMDDTDDEGDARRR